MHSFRLLFKTRALLLTPFPSKATTGNPKTSRQYYSLFLVLLLRLAPITV